MADNIQEFLNPKTFQLLYFNFRYSILKNDRKNMKFYKETIGKVLKKEPSVFEVLNPYKKEELHNLIKIANSDTPPASLLKEIPMGNIVEVLSKSEYEIPEKDLNDSIFKGNISKINELINRDLKVITQECPVGSFGFVDITARDEKEDEFWILELKSSTANHKIIGQVLKYVQHYEGKLINRQFEKVRALTVCGGYDNFSLRELKKIGINTLRYQCVKDTLIFEEV